MNELKVLDVPTLAYLPLIKRRGLSDLAPPPGPGSERHPPGIRYSVYAHI